MNKRMLHVAEKVHAMPDGPTKTEALDLLWRAQANDAYWHGLFGGIYLFNFRVANYANLIQAEALAEGKDAPLTVRQFDFNKDSTNEVVLSGEPLTAIWKPNLGGMMLELDSRPLHYNILNIMTRYEEGYHDEIREGAAKGTLATPEVLAKSSEWEMRDAIRVKEAGIERFLLYDWHRRGAFIDHFLREDVDVQAFYRAFYGEQGDFVNLPYQAEVQAGPKEDTVMLSRSGHVWVGDRHIPIRVVKTFTFRHGEDRFGCTYTVINQSSLPVDVRFAVELASGFDGGQDMKYCHMTVHGGMERLSLAEIREHQAVTAHASYTTIRGLRLTTTVDQPCTLWVFPLETVTNSEAGYERGYQGTVYLHIWNLHLEPNAQWQGNMTQQVTAHSS
jgi:alpha-amylase